ncbi:ribosome recycling factor, partial [Mytilinidion resinicola]
MPRINLASPTPWIQSTIRAFSPSRTGSIARKTLLPTTAYLNPNTHRSFATTPSLHKKAGKANMSHARTDSAPPVTEASANTPTDQAYDLSPLESNILKAMEKLTHDLSQLRSGGRFNPDVVEGLKVQIGKGEGKETARVKELAQVVPKGRVLNVIVGEKEHIKPISSAIAASPYNLAPQSPHPDSPLSIPVPIPPPTGESRKAALEAAHKAGEVATTAVQDARAAHHKKLRKFQVDKSVRPDDLQKATKKMEEAVKRGVSEVKRIVDGARRVLEQ